MLIVPLARMGVVCICSYPVCCSQFCFNLIDFKIKKHGKTMVYITENKYNLIPNLSPNRRKFRSQTSDNMDR